MSESLSVGSAPLTIEQVAQVSRGARPVHLAPAALERIGMGRRALERHIANGEKIYGVNTGVGGNIRFTPDLYREVPGVMQLGRRRELTAGHFR